MKRGPIYMIELEAEAKPAQPVETQALVETFQTAVLLSLLKDGQLTKWQFDRCTEELCRQRQASTEKKKGGGPGSSG